MKLLLSLLLSLSLLSISAQDYCSHDSHTGIDMGEGSQTDLPIAIVEQSDGKFVYIGSSYYTGGNYFEASFFRMNSDNTLDPTFGENSRIGHTWDSRNTVVSATIQEDDKILVGGYQAPGNAASTIRGYVARILPDGDVDMDFAEQGSRKMDEIDGMKSTVVGISQMDEGKIKAAFITNNPPGIGTMQLHEDGSFDSTYAETGYMFHAISDVAWQTDYGQGLIREDNSVIIIGKYLDGGFVAHPFIAKILANGELDSTFAEQGVFRMEEAIPYNFAGVYGELTSTGDILVGTTTEESPQHYLLFKINGETGDLVNEFGIDGRTMSTASGSFNQPYDVVIDEEQEVIYSIGEGSSTGRYPTVWKVDLDGNEVANCDGDATQVFTSGLGQNGYHAGLIDSNGHLRLLGQAGTVDTTSGPSQGFNMMVPILPAPSGLEDFSGSRLTVYPNPAEQDLYIQNELGTQLNYRITDLLGRRISSGTTYGHISIAELNPGQFILQLELDKSTISTHMFLKQ